MRLKVYTSKSNFINRVIKAIEFDSKTIVKGVTQTSTLLMLEYCSGPKKTLYTLTMCVNENEEYCDVILHELKRTLCGTNLDSHRSQRKILKMLQEKEIHFIVLEKDSPVI